MTFKIPKEAYVWIWLPGNTEPVVAGLLSKRDDSRLVFNYGKSYLERGNAISIYEPELPLEQGELPLLNDLPMPSCIRDASPDAWGRRVLLYRSGALDGDSVDNEREKSNIAVSLQLRGRKAKAGD